MSMDVITPGFGTWKLGEGTREAVFTALACGYRHIDTGAIYGNESDVGEAIRQSGMPRKAFTISGKLWNSKRPYDKARKAFDKTLRNLGLDALDTYLIHWPACAASHENWQAVNAETWRALEDVLATGQTHAIGVSNFLPHHLQALMDSARIAPCVNQIELHPGMPQLDVLGFCENHGIAVEAWSPLGNGALLTAEPIVSIAQRLLVSPAQVCLRWCIQHKARPIVRSASREHMLLNLSVHHFSLSALDMEALDTMANVGASGTDPDKINFVQGG